MSFESDVLALQPRLFAFAKKLTKKHEQAEDLVQDALLKALEKRHQYQEGTNLSAWVHTILRNNFLTDVRKSGRFVEDPDDIRQGRMATRGQQFDTVALKELYVHISHLPKVQSEALMLIAVEGFSYDEAAEILGVAQGTVKSRVSRGRTALEKELGPEFLDPNHENVLSYDYYITDNR